MWPHQLLRDLLLPNLLLPNLLLWDLLLWDLPLFHPRLFHPRLLGYGYWAGCDQTRCDSGRHGDSLSRWCSFIGMVQFHRNAVGTLGVILRSCRCAF